MNLARVIGTVWATQKVETLKGHRMLIVQPLSHDLRERGTPLVAVDIVSAAPGQLVYIVQAREAAKALPDPWNPVDTAIIGIVDDVRTETPRE